ncbi:hypothetical protein P4V33_01710 [Brevibacillus borstelensis]|uniref:hypothetical protein n=1 Tax=Brevibacillus borstelensis TaxID=45462 RepID=UPI002E1FB7F0|nr:hypothetical protein [Brevibacillus borstelensis]
MIDNAYLERAAEDLKNRIGSLVVNNQTVPIQRITREGRSIIVETLSQQGITQVTAIRLYDEKGNLITERAASITVADQQRLAFRFEFAVRGEA